MQEVTERPPPDYRDYLETGTRGDDDDSFRHRPEAPFDDEERVYH